MNDVYLFRTNSSDYGTFGLWIIPMFNKSYYSLELPWRDNKINVSCIPTGLYEVEWTYSHTFKKYTYILKDVNGRSGIRIHVANKKHELKGCIALGMSIHKYPTDQYIFNSAQAISEFNDLLKKQSFNLLIRSTDFVL